MTNNKNDISALAKHLKLASLSYLSLENVITGVLEAQEMIGISQDFNRSSFYAGPFNGVYPDGIGNY